MKRDRICSQCGKIYRGDGYMGVCTHHCYVKGEYARKYGKIITPIALHKKSAYRKDAIKKSTENWLKEKPQRSPKEKARIEQLLKTQHVRDSGWSGKQYKAVRG